jgi:hypothetical protein
MMNWYKQAQEDEFIHDVINDILGVWWYTVAPRIVPEEINEIESLAKQKGLDMEYLDTGWGRAYRVPSAKVDRMESIPGHKPLWRKLKSIIFCPDSATQHEDYISGTWKKV